MRVGGAGGRWGDGVRWEQGPDGVWGARQEWGPDGGRGGARQEQGSDGWVRWEEGSDRGGMGIVEGGAPYLVPHPSI